jgi:hypothetical protein
MGWFNVLKGAYPSLQQIDLTLDMAANETGIERGSLIYQVGTTFKLMTGTQATDPTAYALFALMGQEDLTAGMAGTIGQGAPGGVPRLTGLAVGMPFVFETDQFDSQINYTVGMLLTCGTAGKLTMHNSGQNCIAQVTKVVTARWVNDAIAITGWRTGALRNVLTARTLWIPMLVTV